MSISSGTSRHGIGYRRSQDAAGKRAAALLFPLVAVFVAVLLWTLSDTLTFQDDAAQYLSTAAHIQAGDGVRTSVLYYDSQLTQTVPAVQTVWPAGLPALAAGVSSLIGLDVAQAIIAIAIVAHILTALCLGMALRVTGLSIWLSLACAMCWLLSVPSWLNVTRGLSDPLFQMLSLGVISAMAVYFSDTARQAPRFRRRVRLTALLMLSGLITAAVLVRYQALALIFPAALAMSVGRSQAEPMARRFLRAVVVCAAPVGVLLSMFAYNWSLTGALSGGAVSSTGQSLAEVAGRIKWLPGSLQYPFLILLIASCAIAGVVGVIIWVRDTRIIRDRPDLCQPATRATLVYCLAAYSANIGLLVILCLTSTVYDIELRYLGVSALFLIVPVIWASVLLFERLGFGMMSAGMHTEAVIAGVLVLGALSQVLLLQDEFFDRIANAPPSLVRQVLINHPLDGRSTIGLLRGDRAGDANAVADIQDAPVLMSTHAQALSLVTRSAVIGVPVPVYTDRAWSEADIKALARQHGVTYLVAFRAMNTWLFRDAINQMLDKNNCPPWLQAVVATERLVIARVRSLDVKSCESPIPPAAPTVQARVSQ